MLGRRNLAMTAALAALIGAVAGPSHAQTGKPMGAMTQWLEQGSIAPMLEKIVPAVVSIQTRGFDLIEADPLYSHPLFGQVVQKQLGKTPEGPKKRGFRSQGSGVIIDPARGIIMTNFHVIERANEIKVKLTDGRELDGKLIGKDAATDLAAVQIDAKDLTGIAMGDSTKLRVGDFVVAVGNPLGLNFTATMGMVSALLRGGVGWRDYEVYIQHDAAVNTGNSGGALINMNGELVGINTAILSPSGGSVGLGFAIPIVMANQVVGQLVKYGKVRRGTTGLRLGDITPETQAEFGLKVSQGALIRKVQKDSPADKAGLQPGDVITSILGKPIKTRGHAAVIEVIAEVGQTAAAQIDRKGKTMEVTLTIADMKPEQETLVIPADNLRLSGLTVGTIEEDSEYFGEFRGIVVTDVKKGTFPELVGFLPGDIITAVERSKVHKLDDIVELTKDMTGKFDVHVVRKGTPVIVRYPM